MGGYRHRHRHTQRERRERANQPKEIGSLGETSGQFAISKENIGLGAYWKRGNQSTLGKKELGTRGVAHKPMAVLPGGISCFFFLLTSPMGGIPLSLSLCEHQEKKWRRMVYYILYHEGMSKRNGDPMQVITLCYGRAPKKDGERGNVHQAFSNIMKKRFGLDRSAEARRGRGSREGCVCERERMN